ncbi:MAG: hypothetical protein RL154_155 [Pseudomonadota bacterium]|jgi:hypothetical protein
MSKYEKLKNISDTGFKRATGVKKETFNTMVELLSSYEKARKKISGRPSKLCYANQILMMLEYLREYRTYYHISIDYKISECNAYRMIKRAEDVLIKSQAFKLPSKNRLLSEDNIEVILVDATRVTMPKT